jgi:hypothetical protein
MPGVEIAVRPYGAPANLPDSTGAHLPEWSPGAAAATEETDTGSHLPEWVPPEGAEKPEVSQLEAGARGFFGGAGLGFGPAISGLSEAAGPDWQEKGIYGEGGNPIAPIVGAARLLHEHFSEHPDKAVRERYEKGRKASQERYEASGEQYPWTNFLSSLGGAIAVPVPGIAAAGAGGRVLRGALAGGAVAGTAGVGEGIGRGESVPEIAGRAGTGAAIGGALGGTLGGVLGPRLPRGMTPGAKAEATAERIGAPIPQGLASESRFIRGATARAQQVPLVGSRIGNTLQKTQAAAGREIEDAAVQTGGGLATNRATADALVRPGLRGVISDNVDRADRLYDTWRSLINRDAKYTMPRTDAALNDIMRVRQAAHWENPAEGLGQFRRAAGGSTIEGAHRARADARAAGKPLAAHPGYDAGDYNRLTDAMSADLRDMTHTSGGAPALAAFEKAEKEFGPIADQNAILENLLDAKGEASIATLLNATREKGGNLRLLAQLKSKMRPDEFGQVGGTLLGELGQSPKTGEFSLDRFVTNWGKTSDGAKRTLFSPQHLANIEDIVGLGQHLKGSLTESNTSHTAGTLILFDLARDATMLGVSIGTGALTAGAIPGLAVGGAGVLFMHWLATPAKAAAMSKFARAYRGVTLGQKTPARIAVFKIATRELATNLGIPLRKVAARAAGLDEQSNNE